MRIKPGSSVLWTFDNLYRCYYLFTILGFPLRFNMSCEDRVVHFWPRSIMDQDFLKWTRVYIRMYNTMGSDVINLIRLFCLSKDRKMGWVVVRSVWKNSCVHTYAQYNGLDCFYLTCGEVFIKREDEETGRSGNIFCMNSSYLRL